MPIPPEFPTPNELPASIEVPEWDFVPDFPENFPPEESDKTLFENAVGFLSSFSIHLVVLILLIIVTLPAEPKGKPGVISCEISETPWLPGEDWTTEEESTMDVELESEVAENPELTEEVPEDLPEDPVEEPERVDFENLAPNPEAVTDEGEAAAEEYGENATQAGDTFASNYVPAFPTNATLEGRTNAQTRARLLGDGGTEGSERAVERGLQWLFAHQQSDREKSSWGSWSFNLRKAPYCTCENSGDTVTATSSTTGATALALLAMLGHGNTREQGEYMNSVRQGLYYLSTRANRRKGVPGFDLREGSMYGHALATLAICEAYAMEEKPDPGLRALAEGAVKWALNAQDPVTGGWRYEPREAGDVTVTTWMILVLKSANLAGIEVPSPCLMNIHRFLDSVSLDEKALYAYQAGGGMRKSTTAIGLTARLFTGAPRDADFMNRGTEYLSDWSYSGSDLYYNYYATLLLRHYGGPRWERWNTDMRDYLIATQATTGHESGSWYFDEPDKTHNQTGGRLYTTAMAVMTLEVYYRYMPIYGESR